MTAPTVRRAVLGSADSLAGRFGFFLCFGLSASPLWPRQRNKFRNGSARACSNDDELTAVYHVCHGKASFVSWQFHFENRASCLLVQRPEFRAAALRAGREQTCSIAGEQECLRDKQRRSFRI